MLVSVDSRWNQAIRGVFKGPYHSTCRVLNFWLPTVGCLIIDRLVCDNLKFAYFSSKKTDLSSIQDNLRKILDFRLTIVMILSKVGFYIICNINTPLPAVNGRSNEHIFLLECNEVSVTLTRISLSIWVSGDHEIADLYLEVWAMRCIIYLIGEV